MIEQLDGTRETVQYDIKLGIRLYLNNEHEDYPIHWHTAGEIIMPVKNIYTVTVAGKEHVLKPGDIIVLPSGELHQLFAPETGERIIMQFDYSLLYSLTGFDSAFHMFHPCTVITPEELPETHEILKNLLTEITDEYFSDSLLKEGAIYYRLIHFFVTLGRKCLISDTGFTNIKSQKQHEYIDKFFSVCNYMNEHCTEDIDVEFLANLAGFSKYHFMRLFKQFTNVTYYEYLNKHRIMHAERLLLDPNISITEIAMQSGFNSIATFNRIFKAQKNCTPSEYKHLHSANHIA